MNKILIAIGITVLMSFTRVNSSLSLPYTLAALRNGVIAFYLFNNGSLLDGSGNGYHIISNGDVPQADDRTGYAGCAYRFDGAPIRFFV